MKENFKQTSKKVMEKAWEIKKENKSNVWSECLKLAWKEIRNAEFDLTSLKRTELIQLMKENHIKGWYRIYDKATMIEKLTEARVA